MGVGAAGPGARLGAPGPVLLTDAAHLVPLDRPDAVAATVRGLLGPGDQVPPGRDPGGSGEQALRSRTDYEARRARSPTNLARRGRATSGPNASQVGWTAVDTS